MESEFKYPNISLGMGTYLIREGIEEFEGSDNEVSGTYNLFGEQCYTHKIKSYWKIDSKETYEIHMGGLSAGVSEELFKAVLSHEKLHIEKDSFEIVELLNEEIECMKSYDSTKRYMDALNIIEDNFVNSHLSEADFSAMLKNIQKHNSNPYSVKIGYATTSHIFDRDKLIEAFGDDESKIDDYDKVVLEWKDMRTSRINPTGFKVLSLVVRVIKILDLPLNEPDTPNESEFATSGKCEVIEHYRKPISTQTNPEIIGYANMLKQVRTPKIAEVHSEGYMGKKLNRGFITKTKPLAKPFISKTEKLSRDVPKLYFIIDNSGSMCGTPTTINRIFLLAFIEAGYQFEGVIKNSEKCTHITEKSIDVISNANDDGGCEEFRYLSKKSFKDMGKADKIIFISDFCIEKEDYTFIQDKFRNNNKVIPIFAGNPDEKTTKEAMKLFGSNGNVKIGVCKTAQELVNRITGIIS